MGEEQNFYFDLRSLLKLEQIDVRKAARFNMDLLTGEYYGLLKKFINRAPVFQENLEKISLYQFDQVNYTSLESAKILMEAMGCEEATAHLSEIIRVSKRGNKDFAANEAKLLIYSIEAICTEIVSIEKQKDEDLAEHHEEGIRMSYEKYDDYVLYKAIKMIEHEEATRKMRILAVDDAPVILKTISSVLSDEYKVYELSDPKLVKKFLKQITPELFLLDYLMPDINGFDLVPIIRSFEEHKKTPIIFLTSSGVKEHISTALKLGAVDYIVKPFQGKQLREKVAKHIVRKNLF